jgi:hypothetical protein
VVLNIPLSLLREGAEYLPESLAKALADPLALNEAVAALRRYSLIRLEGEAVVSQSDALYSCLLWS